MTKRAGDPAEVLRGEKIQKWLKNSQGNAWFVAGHTRFATRGKVNRRNSHPFRYGRIVGSHNGMVGAPQKFQVDSEYLFWLLNKHRGNYQKALESVSGYWGLSWYDGESFYLMMHSGELAVVEVDGVYYYSSDWKHLDSCTGGDSKVLSEGEVWKFNPDGTIQKSTDEDSGVEKFKAGVEDYSYYCGRNYSASGHTRNYASGGRGGSKKRNKSWWEDHEVDTVTSGSSGSSDVKDYDKEWADAWSAYCSAYSEESGATSLHALSDEEYAIYEQSND